MRIDFWNNPLVVSAFRTKNRYGALYTNLTLYFFFLGGVCMAMGDYPEARDWWRKAVEGAPQFLPSAFELFKLDADVLSKVKVQIAPAKEEEEPEET